jgi:hypothetical protein
MYEVLILDDHKSAATVQWWEGKDFRFGVSTVFPSILGSSPCKEGLQL